ncbi:MAG TPA: hypothetical protein VGQ82_01210 [Chthoniobacterales bacterium]|nr:hypothetical protein [Chthoniobacterales bacterium]
MIHAFAQDQENKLVNRLLKPDMSLGNSAQNKVFLANGASVDKKASVRQFQGARKSATRTFPDQRAYSPNEFAVRHFRAGRALADLSTRGTVEQTKFSFATTSAASVRPAGDATKAVATTEYAGQRPFLGRGKSQKALHAHDTPLTIEQVRELLNKNK